MARAGQRFGFRRFGAGIYTTATSSKANDYVVEAGGSGFRAMILSEVVLGRVSKMTKGDGTLTAVRTFVIVGVNRTGLSRDGGVATGRL